MLSISYQPIASPLSLLQTTKATWRGQHRRPPAIVCDLNASALYHEDGTTL